MIVIFELVEDLNIGKNQNTNYERSKKLRGSNHEVYHWTSRKRIYLETE
jgi:hypothetical protein